MALFYGFCFSSQTVLSQLQIQSSSKSHESSSAVNVSTATSSAGNVSTAISSAGNVSTSTSSATSGNVHDMLYDSTPDMDRVCVL